MKKKLVLEDLRIQSFVTNLNEKEQDDRRGGNSNQATCDHCTPPEYPTVRNICISLPLTDCI